MKLNINKILLITIFNFLLVSQLSWAVSFDKISREEERKKEIDSMQKEFSWWPTDAKPAPVKDSDQGGFWWWPTEPGKMTPWGNRGYIYLYKIIFDYKGEEDQPPSQEAEETTSPAPATKPSLLIKKIVRNVKVYFDYDKSELREDAINILKNAINTLKRYPETSILVTGNADVRGSEAYNDKLGKNRAESVKEFILANGIPEDKIFVVSKGKLNAVAPVTDLVGMQKDRNAQFMIAEVEEVMLPSPNPPADVNATLVEEGKFMVEEEEKVESEVKVSTKEYKVQKNDSLWTIAKKELGSGHRWKYLYELNKDRIKNPNKLKPGTVIVIPVE